MYEISPMANAMVVDALEHSKTNSKTHLDTRTKNNMQNEKKAMLRDHNHLSGK